MSLKHEPASEPLHIPDWYHANNGLVCEAHGVWASWRISKHPSRVIIQLCERGENLYWTYDVGP